MVKITEMYHDHERSDPDQSDLPQSESDASDLDINTSDLELSEPETFDWQDWFNRFDRFDRFDGAFDKKYKKTYEENVCIEFMEDLYKSLKNMVLSYYKLSPNIRYKKNNKIHEKYLDRIGVIAKTIYRLVIRANATFDMKDSPESWTYTLVCIIKCFYVDILEVIINHQPDWYRKILLYYMNLEGILNNIDNVDRTRIYYEMKSYYIAVNAKFKTMMSKIED